MKLDFGTPELNARVKKLLELRRRTAKVVFYLKWEGNKVPRGAIIDGREVAWTQNGIVIDTDGKTIGIYERLTQFGGASGNEQQILVFV